ncbi:4-hydroxy-3-methylbut-2-enyl diphosphate reductase [Gilvimarinus sp. F26214L]|uniref:4-hydroxy-3-methylbut-2-enyl diphosphate reductase n=1 Tax=Gilvimarinus sp. DZF01 TaxID=3461371 RepID=UPI0040452A90
MEMGSVQNASQRYSSALSPLTVVLANPRGFCAGVERAIETVERALKQIGAPVYVRHEIVHNQRVVTELERKGAVFVDEVDEIPPGSVVIFSAHGVSHAVVAQARKRALQVIDATCPLVSKVHKSATRFAEKGYEVVVIGHAGHAEVEGTLGRVPGPVHLVEREEDVLQLNVADPQRVAYVTQTTLSISDTGAIVEALRRRFPRITGPDTDNICYATQNRQNAIQTLADDVDLILVVGANNSSNSNRLRELGERSGIPTYLIAEADQLRRQWLNGVKRLGITAGASAPEVLVKEVLTELARHRRVSVTDLPGPVETVKFAMPQGVIPNN